MSKPSLAPRISCTLLGTVLLLFFAINLANAAPRGYDSIHKRSGNDDDGDDDGGKSARKKNHTATATAHPFTKTWPPFSEPTDSPVGGNGDGRRPDPEYVR